MGGAFGHFERITNKDAWPGSKKLIKMRCSSAAQAQIRKRLIPLSFIERCWRYSRPHRSLGGVTGRTLILLGLFGVALSAPLACADGTSGWLLSERGGAIAQGGDAGDRASGGTGESSVGGAGDGGSAGDGQAGAPTSPPRCPTRFEAQCSPPIVVDNKDAAGSGMLFTEAVSDPSGALTCVLRDVCNILYRKASDIRAIAQVNVVIENFAGVSETFRVGTESTIRISSSHLQDVSDAGGNVRTELDNIFYYHATNIYQFDDGNGTANSWLVQGVANYVRHEVGLLHDTDRRLGGNYNDGGFTTGFFFVWLDTQYPDFVVQLNQSLNPGDTVVWSEQAFADITGQPVTTLWTSYQATL